MLITVSNRDFKISLNLSKRLKGKSRNNNSRGKIYSE